MSKRRKTGVAARAAAVSKDRKSANAGYARALPVMALAWIGLLLATAIASLCPRLTSYYAIYLAATIGLAAGSLAFLDAIYRKGRASLHPAFKKFLGYGLALHYVAAALPRVDWAGAGLIGAGRVAYLFVLACLCLASGLALFLASGRPAAFAALGLITDEEARDRAARKKRFAENRKKGLLHGALEWVDALGFAAILVILINTFIFQLYEIPSESMVPAFLKKDRPFTAKLIAGPRIPLTDWRLPFLRLPQRGDIVTLANPRYPENQSVNIRKYLAQLVSMVTFTAVNIDRYLPDGSEKADPLVKRVVGLPGEKLMMVDDVLYAKRGGGGAFAPVEADRTWASSDLWKESADRLARIEQLPIREKDREVLAKWDAKRREADPAALAASLAASARAIASRSSATRAAAFVKDLAANRPKVLSLVAADRDALERAEGSGNPISLSGTQADDLAIALSALSSARLRAALAEYATAPSAPAPAANAYERGGRALNLLIKNNLLRRVARETELIAAGASFEDLSRDPAVVELTQEGSELHFYVNGKYAGLYDERNFPEFPGGDEYLGPQQYFAMGDNRYNSLDFRYRSGGFSHRPLDPGDPSSVQYLSNIDAFALDLRFIEGYALFRIWPPSRIGAIR